jgi:hypothetical protein
MNDLAGTCVPFGDTGTVPAVSLFRLYTLRAAYLVMAAGLAIYIWPVVIQHTPALAVSRGIQFSLLAGLGAVAALGLRYPVQMLPILLFELTWKAIYLLAFALPLWSSHQITPAMPVAPRVQAVRSAARRSLEMSRRSRD